ncbi:MAG: glycosyltransferase family 4 protein [Dolichospermum sp. BR01]|nr:glycosyltransferase family 4 protein [Dolichospermum sp. BR01]
MGIDNSPAENAPLHNLTAYHRLKLPDSSLKKPYYARENLRDIVWINEYIRDRNAIQGYLSAADVYTLPSRHEGFPVAPLEAMACSLPVVATNVQGIPEILESGEMSGGLIVPIDDVEALAAALESILDNEVWAKELGRRARERVERYFSFESIGQQMRSFLLNQDLPN